jgi:hypothetical protein
VQCSQLLLLLQSRQRQSILLMLRLVPLQHVLLRVFGI